MQFCSEYCKHNILLNLLAETSSVLVNFCTSLILIYFGLYAIGCKSLEVEVRLFLFHICLKMKTLQQGVHSCAAKWLCSRHWVQVVVVISFLKKAKSLQWLSEEILRTWPNVSDAGRGRAGEKQGTDAMKLLGGRKSYKSIRTSWMTDMSPPNLS